MFRKTFLFTTVATAIFLAAPAQAHPKLVSADPAVDSTVAHPNKIRLTFSEQLSGVSSTIDLTMTETPRGKVKAPLKISGIRTMLDRDGKTLVASQSKRLRAGTYRLDYHIVAVNTHRVEGSYIFKVK